MSIDLQEFVRRMDDIGLIKASEVRRFCKSFPREVRPRDVQSLARELVRFGKMTKYQASRIYRGKHRGLVMNNYVILRKIGRGGMGDVYQAEHRRMKRICALKVLPRSVTKSDRAMKRFKQEIEVAAKLTHPNIVTAFDADEVDGVSFLVMEYVDGVDLAAHVDNHGPMAVVQAVDCALQAARGLEYAHSQGVIHRDIKPHNLLMDANGHVKILDMGLVFLAEDPQGQPLDDEITTENQIVGTVDYMSPEQAEGAGRVDHRTDIYSLGCSLHRLIIGTPPFTGDTPVQKILAHREQPAPPLTTREDVPMQLEVVYQRMMAKHRDDRQQSMTELIGDLEAVLATEFRPTAIADSRAVIALDEERFQVDEVDSAIMRFVTTVEEATDVPLAEGTVDFQSSQSTMSGISAGRSAAYLRRRGRRRWLVPVMAVSTIVILFALVAFAWWFSRPTQIIVKWPMSQRRGAKMVVNDREYDLPPRNPIVISLKAGQYVVTLSRRDYKPITHTITLTRGHQMNLPVKWVPRDKPPIDE